MKKCIKYLILLISTALFYFAFFGNITFAAPPTYDYSATLVPDGNHPGVYVAEINSNNNENKTIGIPSITKQALESAPTEESPAIIMGAAVPFERKILPAEFARTDGGTGETGIYAPYNKFRYKIMPERAPDGSTHNKLSGYDGSYVIVRVDVSNLINAVPLADRDSSYLHVKQEANAALMVELGPGGTAEGPTFADALGNKAGSFSLASGGIVMMDTEGSMTGKPYIDVILMSSGTLVAGADIGVEDPTRPSANFRLKFYVDKIKDYNPSLVYDPNYQPPSPTAPTMEALMMAKYYFDEDLFNKGHYPSGTIKPTATVSSYKVMGKDIELEVVNGDSGTGSYMDHITNPNKYWSLRKAMYYETYNNNPIKLICEVPVLEAINIDGTSYAGDRKVILDVNSFDIQFANHKETDAAGLTIKNAEMTVKDTFNTTGAELAVGNNAKMIIKTGGTFIVDATCQLEVEYDAASVTTPSEAPELANGVISIENGGKIINNGIFTIEGTEGKPLDPLSPIRDMQNAVLDIKEGGILENNGCLLSYGNLYCMGTINNNGHYNDLIISQDPDKGNLTFHKGIQISWKDDVTQDNVHMGALYLGKDGDDNICSTALINNNGDIVLVPGYLESFGKLKNNSSGNIYLCPVEEAMIPITPTAAQPLIVEKLVRFGHPLLSYMLINEGGSLENSGNIKAKSVQIINNGRTGDLTDIGPNDRLFRSLSLFNSGISTNSGTIYLDTIYNYGEITNSGSIATKVIISKMDTNEGILYDDAATKLTEIFNASKTVSGSRNIWHHAACSGIEVSPGNQKCNGGTTPNWTILATTSNAGSDIRYLVDLFEFNTPDTEPAKEYKVEANIEKPVIGPVLPEENCNIIYRFLIYDIDESTYETVFNTTYTSSYNNIYDIASVTISSEHINDPTNISNLIYNGEEQKLITAGGGNSRSLEYRLGTSGAWGSDIPTAKNAGNYTVYYKLATESVARGQVDVTIGKRPATISGNDISSKVGTALKELTYTISGLVDTDTIEGIEITSPTLDNTTVGQYVININVSGSNPNYEITTYTSIYTVTNGDFDVIVKDKYGTFSDDIAYKGFNIDLTAPSTVTPYYSLTTVLDDYNYNTAGWTAVDLPDLPATAGTHIVYYYVTDGVDVIKGSKHVIIEKAKQQTPDKLTAHPATTKNQGDCWIEGFEPRAMEYRKIDNDGTYRLAYYSLEYVTPGDYLIRRIGDSNHYPSPDFLLRVDDGVTFEVRFYKTADDITPIKTVSGLAVGDLVERPDDPVWEGHYFLDWYSGGLPFNFNKPVTANCDIVAYWDDSPPHVHVTVLVPATPSTCTEAGNEPYYTCTLCDRWFEDALALIEIRERSSVIIAPLGHDWDSGVVTKEATYDEEGIRIRTCNRDHSHIRTEIIPKKERKSSGGGGGGGGGGGSLTLVNNNLVKSGWSGNEFGWQYIENGSPVKNAWRIIICNGLPAWYYFGENGNMSTGWVNWNNNIYYLYSVSDDFQGQMLVDWIQLEGKWYYLEPRFDNNQGHMYRSERTPDGYTVDANGVWDGRPASIVNVERR